MKNWIIGIFSLVLLASAGIAQTVNRADPFATAKAIIVAYKARDLVTMRDLANETNLGILSELAAQGTDHPRYNSIFQGWRTEAIDSWDGTLDPVRYSGGDAIVGFGESGGEKMVVVMTMGADGLWGFEDVNSPSIADFNAMSTQP